MPQMFSIHLLVFLSTPSARRATPDKIPYVEYFLDISIHALREEGDSHLLRRAVLDLISIHALREEGDPDKLSVEELFIQISIHALREEGDVPVRVRRGIVAVISIHALREEGDRFALSSAASAT